jgi:hypothetical protein
LGNALDMALAMWQSKCSSDSSTRGKRGRKGTRVSAAGGHPLRVPWEGPQCPLSMPRLPPLPPFLVLGYPYPISVPEDPPSQLPPPAPDRRALLQKLARTRPIRPFSRRQTLAGSPRYLVSLSAFLRSLVNGNPAQTLERAH